MSDARPATTRLRCPSCRGRNLDLTETTEALMTWQVTDGRLDRSLGWTDFGGFEGYPPCVVIAGKCGSRGKQPRLTI